MQLTLGRAVFYCPACGREADALYAQSGRRYPSVCSWCDRPPAEEGATWDEPAPYRALRDD
jgi:hypothetical protein